MDYCQAVEYIHNCSHTGGRAGRKRIEPLLEKLGNPHKKMKIVHIAGSSGKGSTAAMTDAVLRKAGYKTGLYMSPYVYDFRERVQLNGQLPDGQLLADALESMIPALDEMKAEGRECTEFETLTALAFHFYAREGCDFMVLEVGIGGRGDVTNVIDPPVVACVNNIGLDHTNLIGNTIAEIAYEKCGIIKPGCRVAAYCDLHEDAYKVLMDTTNEFGITPRIENFDDVKNLNCTGTGSEFDYQGQHYSLSMVGVHQVKNALSVIAITNELNAAGCNITTQMVADALKDVSLAGRFEIVHKNPLCIVDGAHNPDKIGSVCDAIDKFYSDKRIVMVFGMQRKKDFMSSIPKVAKRSSVLISTEPRDVKDALKAEEIADIASQYCDNVIACKDPVDAGRLALGLAGADDVVISCGSLYLVADVEKGINNR